MAEKVSAVMNHEELMQLTELLREAQTLTSGAEENLLKLHSYAVSFPKSNKRAGNIFVLLIRVSKNSTLKATLVCKQYKNWLKWPQHSMS